MGEVRWHKDTRNPNGGFWVETMNPTPRQKKQATKREKEFALVPLRWAAKAAKATRTPGAMVWVTLLFLSWKHNDTTFPFPNTVLARLGISRWTKYRALRALEKTGLVKVDRCNKRSPTVTIVARLTKDPA